MELHPGTDGACVHELSEVTATRRYYNYAKGYADSPCPMRMAKSINTIWENYNLTRSIREDVFYIVMTERKTQVMRRLSNPEGSRLDLSQG